MVLFLLLLLILPIHLCWINFSKVQIQRKSSPGSTVFIYHHGHSWKGFPGGTFGKEPTCQCRRQVTQVQSLDREGPLEQGMAPHSSIVTYGTPWTEEPSGLKSMGLQSWPQRTDWTHMHITELLVMPRVLLHGFQGASSIQVYTQPWA